MTLIDIWEKAQEQIKLKLGTTSFDTWFGHVQIREKDSETLLLEAPDDFFKNWIVDHYQNEILQAVADFSNRKVLVEYGVSQNVAQTLPQKAKESVAVEPSQLISSQKININNKFSFDNFVIGSSNRFACAAGFAVAESPAKAYNPLFIYGQVGLGKTHLLQAITQKISQLHPNLKICYMSSERFTNELIDAIRHRSTNEFRKRYRDIDVLLIDDIQFIAGKESTQEEFFHTFNNLHNNRKQIIITSDRPPKEISNLEERLSSRFAWGLITDIQPPNFETRVAILKKKIENEPIKVPDDIIYYIAEQIQTNIRELEGALIRVTACSLLEEKQMNLDMAKMILKDMLRETHKTISVEMIQKKVSEYYQVPITELKAKKRNKNIVLPRQIAMYLVRKLTKMSLPEIGGAFGGKDHTTVIHSCRKIEELVDKNQDIKDVIEKLSMRLQSDT